MGSRESGGARHVAISVLGTPEVRWADDLLKPPTQKALAILCYLAVRGQPATRSELMGLLWPRGASHNLRTELHRLRRLPGADLWLSTDGAIEIRARTDLTALEVAMGEERFADALASLSDGDLLRGLRPTDAPAFGEWLEVERARVNAIVADTLRGRALELERDGTFGDALRLIRRLIDMDPLDEGAYRAAMRIEYRRGHVQSGMKYFEACRRALMEELGLTASQETLELALHIDRQPATWPRPLVRASLPRLPLSLLRPPRLVGRGHAWARLDAAWEAGQIVLISGPAGVGKTRLMLDFARSKGTILLSEGRPKDTGIPYSSAARAFRDAFRRFPEMKEAVAPWVRAEMARYLPDVFDEWPSMGPKTEDRARLLEAEVQTLKVLRSKVDALIIDDLQFFDAHSLEDGDLAMTRLMEEPIEGPQARILASFRTGQLPAGVEGTLEDLAATGVAAYVVLSPLDEDGVRDMLLSLELHRAPELAPLLHGLTGGNPLFIMDAVKSLYERDDLAAEDIQRDTLRHCISIIVTRRIMALDQPARWVLQAMAALPKGTTPERVASAIQLNPLQVADCIAELERASFLHEGAFVHDLVIDAINGATPPAVSHLLQRHIADESRRSNARPMPIAHR